MPYISIKSFPKEKDKRELLVERINEVLLETWGCSQEAVTISVEEIVPEEWEEKIVKKEINPKMEKMMILSGKKLYK